MQNQKNNLVAKMSSKLKNNQLLAAELFQHLVMNSIHVAHIKIRCETISRWKSQVEFIGAMNKFNTQILEEIISDFKSRQSIPKL